MARTRLEREIGQAVIACVENTAYQYDDTMECPNTLEDFLISTYYEAVTIFEEQNSPALRFHGKEAIEAAIRPAVLAKLDELRAEGYRFPNIDGEGSR